MKLKTKLTRGLLHVKANKTKYLTVLSVIGVGASAVLSFKAGLKSRDILGDDKKSPKEKVVGIAKETVPAAAATVATMGLIFKNQQFNNLEKAGLAAALAAAQKARAEENAPNVQTVDLDTGEDTLKEDVVYKWRDDQLMCEWEATYAQVLEGIIETMQEFNLHGAAKYGTFLATAGAGKTDLANEFLWYDEQFAYDGMEYIIEWYIKDIEVLDEYGHVDEEKSYKMICFPYAPVHISKLSEEYGYPSDYYETF